MEPNAPSAVAPETAFHPAIRRLYATRLGSAEAADRFLAASPTDLPQPSILPSVRGAADRIESALDRGERIGVFGHDDPDGITSAAVLVETLEFLGGAVDPYIPNRDVEGHGLYPELIRRFRARGATLLVTTDGCSTNRAEVDLAATLGMRVIVTDHHEVVSDRPRVPDLVNPKADPHTADVCGDLTGVGVAALVARELLQRRFGEDADKKFFRLLDLVALGTIADWGDLSRTNRVLVVQGLSATARGDRPALELVRRALAIGPDAVLRREKTERLAAVFATIPSTEGRSHGLDALLTRSTWAGDTQALLEQFLAAEKSLAKAIEDVEAAATVEGIFDGAPAVLRMQQLDARALGRAATRLVESTGRPAAVLVESQGKVIGELRAPDGAHLVELLSEMRGLFESWGGHRTAAGFSTEPSRAREVVDGLRAAFAVSPGREPAPLRAEIDLRRSEIDSSFSRTVRAAMPFGRGNPSPVFRIVDYRHGGTGQDVDERARVAVDLIESGFPDRSEGRTPLVTFLPKGRGGLMVRFEGWSG